jgi:hypothetical protein
MTMQRQRFLAIYKSKAGHDAKVIDDVDVVFPFGVYEDDVASDCISITAIIPLPNDFAPEFVVIDDREIPVREPEKGGAA